MRTLKLILLLSLCSFSITPANGQTKESFEQIFLKETEGKESKTSKEGFKNVTRISFYPDTLPTWFYNPPQSSNDVVYAIGISDPDLTPEEAAEQALYRAKIMAVIFSKTKFQYFKDIYTSEYTEGKYSYYRQRFDTYFKVSTSAYVSEANFSVVNQHLTKYNEAVVLVRYQNSSANDNSNDKILYSAIGTVLYVEVQVENAFEPQAEYELLATIKPLSGQMQNSKYTYIEKGNQFLPKSEFLGKEVEYPLYYYKYSNPSWPSNTEPLLSYGGLWSAIIRNMLKQFALSTENSSVKISTVGQQYNPEMANLTREVAIKNAKIKLNGIEFGRDSVGFSFDIREL